MHKPLYRVDHHKCSTYIFTVLIGGIKNKYNLLKIDISNPQISHEAPEGAYKNKNISELYFE